MFDPVEILLNRLHHPLLAEVDLRLDRMHRLLSLLGNPQKRLPPVVHVAGTNGKGSLLAYLMAIFEAAGYRVHRYTSPHLVRFNERIVIGGKPIDNAYLKNLLGHVAVTLQAQPTTFFEATTALAFLAFAEKPADILLVETGVGGRLDATNVIESPALTAITPISFDHMEYLGTTLAAIAGEKAGILKPGVPSVIGRQEPEAFQALSQKAAELHVPLYALGRDWHVETHRYRSPQQSLTLAPSLVGEFQFDNAGSAIACIEQLPQFSITDVHIAEGLAQAVWPARLQKLTDHPYAKALPWHELWLDGGHNPQGGRMLADWLVARGKKAHFICGMLAKKDAGDYLAPLAPHAASMYTVAIPKEAKSQTPQKLAEIAKEAGIPAEPAASVEKALQSVAAHAQSPALIVICGSLYLAGSVLAAGEKHAGHH